MRPEIDLHVMQQMGDLARAEDAAIAPLSVEIAALLDLLRVETPNG